MKAMTSRLRRIYRSSGRRSVLKTQREVDPNRTSVINYNTLSLNLPSPLNSNRLRIFINKSIRDNLLKLEYFGKQQSAPYKISFPTKKPIVKRSDKITLKEIFHEVFPNKITTERRTNSTYRGKRNCRRPIQSEYRINKELYIFKEYTSQKSNMEIIMDKHVKHLAIVKQKLESFIRNGKK